VRRAFEAIRERLATPDGMLESNTVVLDGSGITPLELMQHATAMPFLAPAKLVVVEGLLQALGSVKGGRGKKKADDPLAAWRQVAEQMGTEGALPDTTTLVFIEGDLSKTNVAFTMFAPIAQTTEFDTIKDKDMMGWVKEELRGRKGLTMTDGAVKALVEAVGADLWAMYNELNKLETYAQGATIDEAAVIEVVAQAREAKLWDLTDAVVVGNERKALEVLARLFSEGEPAPLISSLVARQYRQLAIVREMRDQRATEGELARAAGVPPWKVNELSTLAGRYGWAELRRAYQLLLDADLSVKRGLQDDESALQLLIHELCSLAPRAGQPARPLRTR
jgi:DNA polymerase-3 subunit delta